MTRVTQQLNFHFGSGQHTRTHKTRHDKWSRLRQQVICANRSLTLASSKIPPLQGLGKVPTFLPLCAQLQRNSTLTWRHKLAAEKLRQAAVLHTSHFTYTSSSSSSLFSPRRLIQNGRAKQPGASQQECS